MDIQDYFELIEELPHPVQVYDAQGTSVYVNKALLENYHISDKNLIIGIYNVFKDPMVVKFGLINGIKKAFDGERVAFKDIKFPIEDINNKYHVADNDLVGVYHDISAYPLYDRSPSRAIKYVVCVLIERKVYTGKVEICQIKDFIEHNYLQAFNMQAIVDYVGLSKTHLTRLFKKHTGLTVFEYYNKVRIDSIKDALHYKDKSIAQIFNDHGLDYNGHYAKVFKVQTGFTPSEYRKNWLHTY